MFINAAANPHAGEGRIWLTHLRAVSSRGWSQNCLMIIIVLGTCPWPSGSSSRQTDKWTGPWEDINKKVHGQASCKFDSVTSLATAQGEFMACSNFAGPGSEFRISGGQHVPG